MPFSSASCSSWIESRIDQSSQPSSLRRINAAAWTTGVAFLSCCFAHCSVGCLLLAAVAIRLLATLWRSRLILQQQRCSVEVHQVDTRSLQWQNNERIAVAGACKPTVRLFCVH